MYLKGSPRPKKLAAFPSISERVILSNRSRRCVEGKRSFHISSLLCFIFILPLGKKSIVVLMVYFRPGYHFVFNLMGYISQPSDIRLPPLMERVSSPMPSSRRSSLSYVPLEALVSPACMFLVIPGHRIPRPPSKCHGYIQRNHIDGTS